MSYVMKSMRSLALAVVLAAVASMFSVGVAFASPTISVSFTDPANSSATYTANVDLATVQNTGVSPFFGQFYKDNASTSDYGWHVLGTGSAAGQYAKVSDVLQKALDNYNSTNETEYVLSNIFGSSNTLALTAGTPYTKYYPTYADVMGTVSNYYFFNLLTNAEGGSAFPTSGGFSNPWTVVWNNGNSSAICANPQNGAVLAWEYGVAQPASLAATTSCTALAGDALDGIASHGEPRMFFGAPLGGSTAGKRFCTGITAIAIQ